MFDFFHQCVIRKFWRLHKLNLLEKTFALIFHSEFWYSKGFEMCYYYRISNLSQMRFFLTTFVICYTKVPTASSVFAELWLLEDYSLRWLSRSNEGLRITGFSSFCLLRRCMISFFSEVKNRLCKIEKSSDNFVKWEEFEIQLFIDLLLALFILKKTPSFWGNAVSFDVFFKIFKIQKHSSRHSLTWFFASTSLSNVLCFWINDWI